MPKTVYDEIKTERKRQEQLWGTSFDDKNTPNDWATYMCHYATSAATQGTGKFDLEKYRSNLIKTATLAIAALEALKRNQGVAPRHYDRV
jgi:hypothetical protein